MLFLGFLKTTACAKQCERLVLTLDEFAESQILGDLAKQRCCSGPPENKNEDAVEAVGTEAKEGNSEAMAEWLCQISTELSVYRCEISEGKLLYWFKCHKNVSSLDVP